MTYPDPTRPGTNGSEEPSVLDLLGFGTPSAAGTPAAPPAAAPHAQNLPPHARAPIAQSAAPAGSRREQRELERKPQSGSAARRVRAIEKAHRKAARKLPKGARVAVATTAASRPVRGSSRARSIGSRILSVSAMIFAGALAVGMSVPANAFNTGAEDAVLTQSGDQTVQPQAQANQSMEADETVATTSAARDEYTVTSWAEMLRLQYGTRDYAYELGDPNGPIRWPFPYAVPISSGFGERAAPCHGCSSMHMGVDFTPGGGTPIYAIADGVVSIHDDDSGGYGNHVYIDHGNLVGTGQIQSLYAHMQHGSSPLVVGQQIKVGDFIGLVGMTGAATGNHLHFEVLVNGVQVDPFAWLQTNT